MRRLGSHRALVCAVAALGLLGCREERERATPPLVYDDVSPALEARCVECHGGLAPAAGYNLEGYFETIRCIPDPEGQVATLPADATAPIVAVLNRSDHADLLDDSETEALTTWVVEGAVPNDRGTHPGAWNDPRAGDWHGTYLASTDWQPIVDPARPDACGLCHPGSPAAVEGVVRFPPGATDCTECHDEPGGVMACGTCHGDGERPYLPRDTCYFRPPRPGYGHSAHVRSSANNPSGLGCEACHFGEDYTMLQGRHGNGVADVVFQPAWGADAAYDPDSQQCATTCHQRGGEVPDVRWDEGALDLDCAACHRNPPIGHSTIACDTCHLGIDEAGTSLTPLAPHINGRVDVR